MQGNLSVKEFPTRGNESATNYKPSKQKFRLAHVLCCLLWEFIQNYYAHFGVVALHMKTFICLSCLVRTFVPMLMPSSWEREVENSQTWRLLMLLLAVIIILLFYMNCNTVIVIFPRAALVIDPVIKVFNHLLLPGT